MRSARGASPWARRGRLCSKSDWDDAITVVPYSLPPLVAPDCWTLTAEGYLKWGITSLAKSRIDLSTSPWGSRPPVLNQHMNSWGW